MFMGLFAMGQDSVQTPWGSTVSVWTQSDMIPSQRKAMDDSLAIDFPDAQFHPTLFGNKKHPYPSSSSKFNCHGYAWHMYWFGAGHDLDDPYNMHSYEAENYFDDPSFAECTESEADILWINDGAHSALTTDDPDDLLSKWATGPLATHGKGSLDSPWPPIYPNTVTYYKKCAETYSTIFSVDTTMNECAVKIENSSISNYVDLEFEYEEGVLIEGTFTTGVGATLYIHPD